MPVSEVQLVDAAARVLGQDRAGFIRQALVYCSGVALRRAGGAPESVTTGEAP